MSQPGIQTAGLISTTDVSCRNDTTSISGAATVGFEGYSASSRTGSTSTQPIITAAMDFNEINEDDSPLDEGVSCEDHSATVHVGNMYNMSTTTTVLTNGA